MAQLNVQSYNISPVKKHKFCLNKISKISAYSRKHFVFTLNFFMRLCVILRRKNLMYIFPIIINLYPEIPAVKTDPLLFLKKKGNLDNILQFCTKRLRYIFLAKALEIFFIPNSK